SAETISKLLPIEGEKEQLKESLAEIMEQIITAKVKGEGNLRAFVQQKWSDYNAEYRFVFNKLLTGGYRVGVAKITIHKSLADAYNIPYEDVALRLMGKWSPQQGSLEELLTKSDKSFEKAKPYPFMLAKQLDKSWQEMGDPTAWLVEYKWDGIRGQIVKRDGEVCIWSRGEELVSPQFPELLEFFSDFKSDFVLDGELLPIKNEKILPFNVLQTRLNRKTLSPRLLRENPVGFFAYDVLEWNGTEIRGKTQSERRDILEDLAKNTSLKISQRLYPKSWSEVEKWRSDARNIGAEGLMLKRLDSDYKIGRVSDTWFKFKCEPFTIDAVLLYAQAGRGRRANLYTDYSLAVWDGDQLLVVAKAYSGLTDEELLEVDRFIKANTKERFGPVRSVKPELVFEVAFEGIQESKRHKSGVATRFPRINRWRRDKKATDADRIETLREMAKNQIIHD
ncbi:MAG: ATP-dependent DNA ligase, partial [Luteibaculum sp.]